MSVKQTPTGGFHQLRVTSDGPTAMQTRVELDDVDISSALDKVTLLTAVGRVHRAVLHLVAPVFTFDAPVEAVIAALPGFDRYAARREELLAREACLGAAYDAGYRVLPNGTIHHERHLLSLHCHGCNRMVREDDFHECDLHALPALPQEVS